MRQSTTLRANVPNLLRRSTRVDMVGLEDVSIAKFAEQKEFQW